MTEKSRVNILLVDDQPGKLLTYETVLQDLDETLIKASSAAEAFDCLLRNDIAVILVDVFMPDLDGYQLATMIREHPRFKKTPIIFISAVYLSEVDRLRGYETGAVDYVPVPVVPEILRAKVRVFVELHRKTRELERLNRELEERVALRTTELRQSEEHLRLAAEAAEFGTYECDLRSQRIFCSEMMKRLLGREIESNLGLETFLDLIHPGDQSAVRQYLMPVEGYSEDRHEVEFRVRLIDGTERWVLDCGRAFYDPEGKEKPSRIFGTVLDITQRKQVEERQLLLMAELDHRVKNILANVSAIANLSSKRAGSVEEYVKTFDARILAVAKAHNLLRSNSWVSIGLESFLEEILEPFNDVRRANVVFAGPPVNLLPKAAQSLALVVHELATNAAKYGALSAPDGKVHIAWERLPQKGSDVVRLAWNETGGPAVEAPASTGFGLNVIKMAAAELDATITHEFLRLGLSFHFEGRVEQTAQGVATGSKRNASAMAVNEEYHAGDRQWRILVVEDEPLVALQVKHDLEADGHHVVALALTQSQGIELAGAADFDVAFLDIRLKDSLSTPIAHILLKRGIPFAFGTGFGDDSVLPASLRAIPKLAKPYEAGSVSHLLAALASPEER